MRPDLAAFAEHLRFENKSASTVERYLDVLRELEASSAPSEPRQATFQVLRSFAVARRKDGTARDPAGINVRVSVLRAYFAFLVAERGLVTNPAANLKGVREPRRPPKFLEAGETKQLLAHLAGRRDGVGERNLALVILLWQRGLRVSEAARLTVGQFDGSAAVLRDVVRKGGHVVDLELNRATCRVLARYIARREQPSEPAAPLFPTRSGGPLSVRAIEAVFEKVRNDLGWVRRFYPHILRHTFGTDLLSDGTDIATVAVLLDHADLRTVQVYAKVRDPARRLATDRLGKRVPLALVVPPTPVANNVTDSDEGTCGEGQFSAAA